MKIKSLFIISLLFVLLPGALFAQDNAIENNDEIFKARVIEIIEGKVSARDDGSTSIQQKLKLKGLEGQWKNKEIIFDGTSYDVIANPEYKVGDKVLVNYSPDMEGNDMFYIAGFVRQGSLYWLALLFAIVVVAVGRLKGLRALVVLLFTFLIILKFIIPKILAGGNPLLISIVGSLFILILAIYITEGFKRTSTIAIFSVLTALIITGLLSVWFTAISKLTGFASDEAIYLMGVAGGNINIRGLLLAGIIIGALGVLDDIAVTQVALVRELKISNPQLSKKQIYGKAMKVGVSHLGSMVNTLFLAYAGAALPLLILFSVKEPPFLTFNQVINNEIIATEIVRTLTGSIGLVLAVPLATLLAVHFVKLKNSRDAHS